MILFSAFDKQSLICLAPFYPHDFSTSESVVLEGQHVSHIFDMRESSDILGLKGIGDLAERLVRTKRNHVYPLVCYLLTLALFSFFWVEGWERC